MTSDDDERIYPKPALLNQSMPVPKHISAPTLAQVIIERIRAGATLEETKEYYRFAREIEADEAAKIATADFVAMQAKLPAIPKLGEIDIGGKKVQRYMRWEDINRLMKPVLTQYNYALNFHFVEETEISITMTGILKHKSGYIEQTTRKLPLDKSGSKNLVQSYGSTQSYAQRYIAIALLNLVAEGEDTDATSEYVSAEQIAELDAEIKRLERTREGFCEWQKIEHIQDLPLARFEPALRFLKGLKHAPTNP